MKGHVLPITSPLTPVCSRQYHEPATGNGDFVTEAGAVELP